MIDNSSKTSKIGFILILAAHCGGHMRQDGISGICAILSGLTCRSRTLCFTTMNRNDPIFWLLLDNRAGNRSQVMGTAEALGLCYFKKELEYTVAGALPNTVLGSSFLRLTRNARAGLCPPWPDLVVAAGRRTAPIARYIKKKNGGRTFLTQIMYPGKTAIDDFGLVVAPHHDSLPERSNFLQVTGAPHGITQKRLAAAALDWKGRFDYLPAPHIAVIVGGDTKRRHFSPDFARDLGKRVANMARRQGGSLLITTSRRTQPDAAKALLEAAEGVPSHIFCWGDEGNNPYLGYLSSADAVVVTGDSMSMCSEACAVSRPVYIYAPKKLTTHKHGRLHKDLFAKGYARPLGYELEQWTHAPLNAANDIAAEIRKRIF